VSGRGAERILDVIEWLAAQAAPVSLAEAVQALDLPKSSTLLLLRTLVERRYAERLSSGRYRLVRLPGEASAGRDARGTILRIAEPHLRAAVAESQETGFVAVLDASRIRYLNKLLPAREIRYDRDITHLRTAHHVASGMVLLAALPAADLAAYLAALPVGPAGDGEITESIDKARRDGYAVNLKGLVEGAAGVAAPIRDGDGRVVAAVNISGPKDRINANLDQIIDVVVKTARSISDDLRRRSISSKSKLGSAEPTCSEEASHPS